MCKKSIKNLQPFVKKNEKYQSPRGDFFDSHCIACNINFLDRNLHTGDSKRTLQVMNLSTGKPVKVSNSYEPVKISRAAALSR